jgi:hypothetical protein
VTVAFIATIASIMAITSVISLIATVSIAAVTSVVIAIAIIPLTINRYIFVVVPAILYKVDWVIAGIITTAIAAPVLSVAWWHPKIKRFVYICMTMYDDRPAVNYPWCRIRIISDVYATIKTGLAYADGYSYIGSQCCARCGQQQAGNQEMF